MEYDLDLEKAVKSIKKLRAKKVCIQLPDGLKPQAAKIAKELEQKTNAKIFIWINSNWGSCDLPVGLETVGIDLLINFGHSSYNFKDKLKKKKFTEI